VGRRGASAFLLRRWRAEHRGLRRGLVAVLLAAVIGIVAGLSLAAAQETLERLPGLLLLIPAAINMRGNIYGALAARLSTALHLGTYDFGVGRRSFLGRQAEATTLLTLATSVLIALVAWVFGVAFGVDPIPIWKLVVISAVGGSLASAVLLAVTIALSWVARRRDWNMDDVGAPTVTVFGDVLTIPALLLASLLVDLEPLALILGLALTGMGVWAVVRGWVHSDGLVRRIVRESAAPLTFAVGIGAVAGIILELRLEVWISSPVLLIMIPSFIANCGSLGGILSSRLASRLHLGLIRPGLVPQRGALHDAGVVFVFAIAAFSAIGISAWGAARIFGYGSPGLAAVVGLGLTAGLISTLFLSVVAYAVATASVHFGLDPDNEGIPIVTSTMDLLGLIILVAISVLLWGG